MSKKALGKGLPDHIKEREMKAEFEQVIEAWRAEGYNVQRLEGILELDMDSITQAFALFDNDVRNLKDIAEIIEMMETAGFEQDIKSIRQKLKDPDLITEVLQEVHELDNKIKTKQTMDHKQVVDKKVDEWKGTLEEGKSELMDLWEQSEQESIVKDPAAVREAAAKVEDPTDAAIEDRLANLRNRLSKLSMDKTIPLRSDKIGMLKDKLNAVGSTPAEPTEKPSEPEIGAGPTEESTPVEEPPVEESTPVEEPPVEESTPVEEPPVEESTPVEEPPVEESTPVEEPPVEELTPVEEPPVEESTPVEEPSGEDDSIEAAPAEEPAAAPEVQPETPETPLEPVQLTPEQREDVAEAINMAKEMYRNKEYQKAIEYFDMALEMDPGNSDAIFFRKRAESKLD